MDNKIYSEITRLKHENNWQAIVNQFDERIHENNHIDWNNCYLIRETGFAQSQLGNYQRAMELYHRWLELESHRAQPYYCIGFIYYQQQQYQQALPWFEKALQRFPNYIVCLYRKGVALLKTQKSKMAHDVFQKVIQIYETFEDQDEIMRHKKTYIRALFEDGKACFHFKNIVMATKLFDQTIELDKKNYINPLFKYYNLGKCYLELGDKSQTLKYLEMAKKINNKKDYVWERLGRYHHKLTHDFEQAERCFKQALKCRRVSYILFSYALLLIDQDQHQRAFSFLREALNRDTKGKHKILFVMAKLALKLGKLNDAETYLNRAIQFKLKIYGADYAEAHYYLSLIWQMRGEEQKSKNEIEQASRIKPELEWSKNLMNEDVIQFHDLDILTEEIE